MRPANVEHATLQNHGIVEKADGKCKRAAMHANNSIATGPVRYKTGVNDQ